MGRKRIKYLIVLLMMFSMFMIPIQPIGVEVDNTPKSFENLTSARDPIIHEPDLLSQALDFDTFGISIDNLGELESPPYPDNSYNIGFQNWSGFMERRMYMKFDISNLADYGNLILPYLNVSLNLTFGNAMNSSGYGLPSMTFPMNISLVEPNWNLPDILSLSPPYNISKLPKYLNKSIIVNVSVEEGLWITNTVDLTHFLNGSEKVCLMFTSDLDNFRFAMFGHRSGDPSAYIPRILITLNPREIPETPTTYYTSLNENNSKTIQYMHHHYFTFNSAYQVADYDFDFECFKNPFYVDIIVWMLSEENYQKYLGEEVFIRRLRIYDPYWTDSGYNNEFINSGGSGMGFENGTYYILFINLDSDNESVTLNYDFNIDFTDKTPPEPEPEPEPITQPPTIPSYDSLIIIGLIIATIFYIIRKQKRKKTI